MVIAGQKAISQWLVAAEQHFNTSDDLAVVDELNQLDVKSAAAAAGRQQCTAGAAPAASAAAGAAAYLLQQTHSARPCAADADFDAHNRVSGSTGTHHAHHKTSARSLSQQPTGQQRDMNTSETKKNTTVQKNH